MKIHEYNEMMAYLTRPARVGFAKAGIVDSQNNIKKGQDLGEGIAQRLKYTNKEGKKTIRYVTSGMKDTPIEEHKTFKEAQNYRKNLIEKYGDPKELGEYKGKYNYKELIKDKDFEDFWKAKVDGDKIATRTGKFKGERSVEDAIQKVIDKYELKSNDYEGIWNKTVEETRISEAVRKGTRAGQGKTKLISAAIVDNLVETFNKSYKPNVGTINTSKMEELLKLSKGELSKLMSNIEKPYPEEALRFAKSDTVSRINKAAALKDILEQEGITYSKMARSGREGTGSAEYRFKLDSDKNKAAAKLKELKNSKTFGFLKQTTPKSQNVKQIITTLSKQSDEYKKYGYGRDRNAINNLTKALNNSLRSINDKELYNFVDKNPKIKNLVTATFDAKTGQIKNVPLKKLSMDQIRNNAQFEVDHIRGRSTVDFDATTKKILDGLDIEYPKNLYIIPKAINNSVKKQVENFVSNFPNETSKIKNIDNYFKKNKLTYFNRNTGDYGGYKPSKSALDISHLGITKKKELENLITGTYIDEQGVERVKTKDPKKTIATINEINKTRGGTKLKANMVPGLETLIKTVSSMPDDFRAKRYWTLGLKGLGIAAVPLVAYDGYTAIRDGLPPDEVVAKALLGADKLLYKGKEILQLTPEEREARNVVKQNKLRELNEDQMMGFGFIEGPEVDSNLTLEEAKTKLKESQDRYANFREERDAARASERAGIAKSIKDRIYGVPLEEITDQVYNQGGRVGFDKGSKPKSPGRRTFLKGITALAALPLVGKYFKLGKVLERSKTYLGPTVEKVKGMPEWFPGLVKKLYNEGEDVTKQVATKERMVVKRGTLEGGDDVDMIYDLDTGDVSIEVVPKKGEFSTKSGAYEKPYGLDYKKGQADEMTGGTPADEFGAVEARPFQVGRNDVDLDYDMVDIDDAMSDLQELENFAKKKK